MNTEDRMRREREIENNPQSLFPILEIKFLAKQALPFRGHDDSSQFLQLVNHQAKFDQLVRNQL